ncbi:MAG: ATPase, T2SS/T4P/T4SS family [Gammaproteobacteria bacterium]
MQALQTPAGNAGLTELCINRPHEAWLETTEGWQRQETSFDCAWCVRFAKLVGHSTRQRINEESPLLSAWLPTGERVQIVMPPATPAGTVAIAIRVPARELWSLADLSARGIFERTRIATTAPNEGERELTNC